MIHIERTRKPEELTDDVVNQKRNYIRTIILKQFGKKNIFMML